MAAPQELRFIGQGVDQLIMNGHKLVTLRSEPKGFPPVTQVMGRVSETATSKPKDIPLVVVSEETHALNSLYAGILLLDGFLNYGAALDVMKDIYPQRVWDETSVVASILFLTQELADGFGPCDIPMVGMGGTQEEGLRGIRLETLVFPAYFYWLVNYHGIPEEKYPEELHKRGIIDDLRVQEAMSFYEASKKAKKKDDKKWNH